MNSRMQEMPVWWRTGESVERFDGRWAGIITYGFSEPDCSFLLQEEFPGKTPDSDWARLLVLHERLVAGELEVSNSMAEALLPYLTRRIQAAFPQADEQIISDASTDAIVEYLQNPRRFDASRGVSLQAFLYRASCNNLRDRLQAEGRRKRREATAGETFFENSVELHPSEAHVEEKGHSLWSKLELVIADPLDRQVLKLWFEGEWRTAAFAKLMGISDLPTEEQRRLVKQTKDRLVKTIQRKWRSTGVSDDI